MNRRILLLLVAVFAGISVLLALRLHARWTADRAIEKLGEGIDQEPSEEARLNTISALRKLLETLQAKRELFSNDPQALPEIDQEIDEVKAKIADAEAQLHSSR